MTTRAKELADRFRSDQARQNGVSQREMEEAASLLDAKAAIDSAVTGEVREIQERHEQDLKDAKVSRVAARSWTDAHNDRATLLAIVQRQVGEVATLTTNQETIRACLQDGLGFKDWTGQHLDIEWLLGRAGTEYRSRVRLQQQLDAARAEVERLAALVDDFKAASMLDVGGDPDGVTPRLLERHVAALQNEVERLKDAGVTIHACPPKGECMMPCCGWPPFEVMGSRMTTNPALVNCDRHRLLGEVERLKGELHDARTAELNALNAHESTIRRHSEFAQRHTSMEAQLVTELTAQTDKLRSERSSLAAENARLVSEHAALSDVLRIVAEHDQQCADLTAAIYGFVARGKCTCGEEGICGWCEISSLKECLEELQGAAKGGGEPARTELPGHHVTAPPVGQAGGDLLPRPIHGCKHIGPDGCCAHPRAVWRNELERLLIERSRKNLCLLTADRLEKLDPLAKLVQVIASGRGQAVVPDGVAKLLGMNLPAQWMARRDHGEVICTHSTWAPYIWGPAAFMRIVDEYGDSLCGAP